MAKTITLSTGKVITITRKNGKVNFDKPISFDELKELQMKNIV